MSTNLFIINKNRILIPKLNKKIKIIPKRPENSKISINLDINKLFFDKQIKNFKSFSTLSLDNKNTNLNENQLTKKPNTSLGQKKKYSRALPKINSNKILKVLSLNNVQDSIPNFNSTNNNCIDDSGVIYDINNYKNISMNLLVGDKELSNMFEEIYKRKDYEIKQKWIEINLFKREVFKIRLESCIRKKLDVTTFLKTEINKILRNKLLDHIFLNSYRQIQLKCEEHINVINNLYN